MGVFSEIVRRARCGQRVRMTSLRSFPRNSGLMMGCEVCSIKVEALDVLKPVITQKAAPQNLQGRYKVTRKRALYGHVSRQSARVRYGNHDQYRATLDLGVLKSERVGASHEATSRQRQPTRFGTPVKCSNARGLRYFRIKRI